jgi:iron complex transport system substrate-binding protein
VGGVSVASAIVHRPSRPRGRAILIRSPRGLSRPTRRSGRRALLPLILAAAGCASPPAGRAAGRIVDDAGDTVAVSTPAHRIVSLIPATTELLFALGAGGSVVGRTTWCDYPAAAASVPNLGDGIAPNLEAVLASRPDLVLLYNSAQNASAADRLRQLGIPALRLNTDRLADVDRVGRLLGRLTGRAKAADSVAGVFDTALASATAAPQDRRPRVLLLVWEQPPMTIGHGSFLSELVTRAGGANLFDDVSASAGAVSIEAVTARDPELILTTSAGPASFARRPEWQVVRAVRERRFLPVNGSEFNRPSPRAPQAIRELAAKLRRAG